MTIKSPVSLPKDKKLNQLMKALPEGVAASSAWLKTHGISRQLVQKYVDSSWLLRLAHGCYVLPGSPATWEGVLLGLSKFGGMTLHVGGLTALRRSGDVHYLEVGGELEVEVWMHCKPPKWAAEVQLQPSLNFHHKKLFLDNLDEVGISLLETGVRDWTLQMSAPERAILEMISNLGDSEEDFLYASEMVEGLTLARPALVQQLLEGCTSIKVKRLFLFLADYHQLRWLKRLDMKAINLGKGKRQIVKGGQFNQTFQITVPSKFHG